MSFYTAAVGAGQHQQRLNVQANNIANVNTYGYKAEKPSFASLMYTDLRGIEEANLPKGTGARVIGGDTDFKDGPLMQTGRAQDYAIVGKGYFGLYDAATGEVSYTRDGTFTLAGRPVVNEDGEEETVYMLSDGEGRFVLNNRGALLEVTDPEAPQPVGVFDFMYTNGMRPVGDNRYLPAEKDGQVRFGTGEARQGMLEMSNTDLAYELSKVIEAQRSFSYTLRMVQTSDEVETTINGLRG